MGTYTSNLNTQDMNDVATASKYMTELVQCIRDESDKGLRGGVYSAGYVNEKIYSIRRALEEIERAQG